MSTPVFNQVGSLLLYELSTLPIANAPDYWAGYFATASSNFGASAGTAAVWQDVSGGFYLFLDKKPADFALFVKALEELRPSLGPPNMVRFVWISNADKSYLKWQTTVGLAAFGGSAPNTTWTLKRSIAFIFGAYQLTIAGLNTLTYIADTNGGGIQFTTGGNLGGPEGGYAFPSATMSFTGPALGAFNGEMNIQRPQDPGFAGVWSALNIGLLYGAAPAETDLTDNNYTQMVFMPVFDRQKDTLNLGLLLDPLYLQEPTRTALSLFPPGGNPSIILDSYLRTTRGYTIQLTPLAGSGAIPDARFVLGACPIQNASPDAGLRYHFSPDGAFRITVKPPDNLTAANSNTAVTDQLLLGLSGLEYANLGNSSYMIAFEGGKPAYIPPPNKNKNVAPDVSEALTNAATTSHLTVLAVNNQGTKPVYFAQPQQAPVFSNREQRADNVLDYNPMPAYTLTYNGNQRPQVFPSGVYAGLTGANVLEAFRIENASLAPYRSYCLGKDYGVPTNNEMPLRRLRNTNDPLGVTPQGLVAELTTDYNDYDGLILGNMPGTEYPRVDLSAVQGKFKQVLQSNQLFFVAANVDELMLGTSVRYMLTDAEKPYLLAMGVPQNIINAVYQTLVGKTQPFETERDYVTCIGAAATTYLPYFLKIAGILKVEMDGWVFQLSPRSWRTDAASPTIMIGKFCNRTLMDLANDTSSWLWPEVAVPKGSSLANTQAVLVNMFKAAAEPDASDALKIFYNTVVNDANWNGFLFLNAPTDISEMPDELKFLTAGIDLKQFYAHHIGFSQTPFSVESGMPKLQQTAAFGLINYDDPVDLYSDETIALGFKTMKLQVRFANASLADFSTQVELMLNQMLGTPLSKQLAARGNNLIIDGSYQRVGGAPGYSFALIGENVFLSNGGSAITSFEVLSVQLVNGGNKANPTEVLTTFILSGKLRFVLIEGFDLFSFGPGEDITKDYYLRYSGLSIDMQFLMTTPQDQTFTVREANTAFDMTASDARPSSLINNFPLAVSALIASPDLSAEGEAPSGQTPEDMGYTSVSAPIDQTPMKPSWYGLVFTLDLGTFGALTGSVSFKISILAAWSKGAGEQSIPVYMGLKLPGINAIAGSFPIQGVLKIGFRNFQFETYETSDNKLGYLLRLRNFSLSALLWSFPPGNNNIILFGQTGNPKGSLGWYAAYDSGTNKKPNTITDIVQRRLETGKRIPPVA